MSKFDDIDSLKKGTEKNTKLIEYYTEDVQVDSWLTNSAKNSIINFKDRIEFKKNNLYHRLNGPAIDYNDGSKLWFFNGERHRSCDRPAIVWNDGYKAWYTKGQLHREGGLPAIEWFNNNHRKNDFWLNGQQFSNEKGLAYAAFCQKMQEKKKTKAQKKIYFWWIQICYDMEHPSGCGQRMADRNLALYQSMVKNII